MSKSVHQSRRWYSPRSIALSIAIRPRLYLSALAGVTVFLLLPSTLAPSVREALAWDLSAAIYLTLVFRVMLSCTSDVIRVRAARRGRATAES
jgi:uncharacterized membrane protein